VTHVTEAVRALGEELKAVGCKLNTSKTQVFALADLAGAQPPGAGGSNTSPAAQVANDLQATLCTEGVEVLGAEMGSATRVKAKVDKTVKEAEEITKKLELIDAQSALLLARHCLTNNLSYIASTHSPQEVKEGAERFNAVLNGFIDRLLLSKGQQLSHAGKMQAQLPVKAGGLGIVNPANRVTVQFLGTVAQTLHTLKEYNDGTEAVAAVAADSSKKFGAAVSKAFAELHQMAQVTNQGDAVPANISGLLAMGSKVQHKLTEQVVAKMEAKKVANLIAGIADKPQRDNRLRAWESAKNYMACAATCALPRGHNILADIPFKVGMLIRLGEIRQWPTNDPTPQTCHCGQGRPDLQHLITCSKSGEQTIRHTEINDGLAAMIRATHRQVYVEPSLANIAGGKDGMRGDLATYNLTTKGVMEVIDVSVASTYATSVRGVSAGVAAGARHAEKMAHYKDITQARSAAIIPVAFDTSGCPAPQGSVDRLVAAIASKYDVKPDELDYTAPNARAVVTQRLACCVLRATASAAIRLRGRADAATPGLHSRSGKQVEPSAQMQAALLQASGGGRGGHGGRGAARGASATGRGAGAAGRGRGRGRGAAQASH